MPGLVESQRLSPEYTDSTGVPWITRWGALLLDHLEIWGPFFRPKVVPAITEQRLLQELWSRWRW
jgi:hypothetical protein